jgi:hypothetical protein
MAGIQNLGVINNLERLDLDDLSLDQGAIDPSTVSPVYPIEAGWIGLSPITWTMPSTSINGAVINQDDTGPGLTIVPTQNITVAQERYYSAIRVAMQGGTVSPIRIVFNVITQGQGAEVLRVNMTNPSGIHVAPILLGPGQVLRISSLDVGGAGDTIFASAVGIIAKSGVPIPIVPSATLVVGV